MVITIQIWFRLTRFRKDFGLYLYILTRIDCYPCQGLVWTRKILGEDFLDGSNQKFVAADTDKKNKEKNLPQFLIKWKKKSASIPDYRRICTVFCSE